MTKTYFFNNDQYLRWTIGEGADPGYPKNLSNWHAFLADGVDAAVNWGIVDGKPKAYFFKGNQYLRWTIGEGADPGYPINLSNWHAFLADGVDAAVNWGIVNGKPKAYFFKDNQYLRWTIGEGADQGYPKDLSNWHAFLTGGVDVAFNWGLVKGTPKAYFFKDAQYLRWTIGTGPDPGYPKPLSNWGSFVEDVDAAVNWSMNMGDIFRYFRPNYVAHSKTNAYLLSLLSLYIYKDLSPGNGDFSENFNRQFENLSSSNPFKIQQFDSNSTAGLHTLVLDTQAAVLTNSEVTLVVFRGSESPLGSLANVENIRDWIVDGAGAAPETEWTYDGIADMARVHSGFKQSVDAVYDDVCDAVTGNGSRPVFLTGHSLGGALALLCAYRLRAVDHVNVGGVYTFAAPRPGNGHFRYKYDEKLRDRTFCWEYKDDPVPHFPPTGFTPFSPSHVGQLNRVMHNGTIKMDDDQPFIPLPLKVGDHYMTNYVQTMQQRLSDDHRTGVDTPDYLVDKDVVGFG